MKVQEQNLKLKEIIALQSAIKMLNDTNQSIPFDCKIQLGIIKANLSIITTPYYEGLEEERQSILKTLGINPKEEVSNQQNENFSKMITEFQKEALEKEYLIKQVPVFTTNMFKEWNDKVKDIKDKQFDPPMVFFELIEFLINE